MTDIAGVINRAAGSSRTRARQVEAVKLAETTSLRFNLQEINNNEKLDALFKDVGRFADDGQPTVYVFRLLNPARYVAVKLAFGGRPESLLGSDTPWKYSSMNDNEPHYGALYVGSSKSLTRRISQHVRGSNGAGTYSMRLNL